MKWITPVTNRSIADIEEVKSLKQRIYLVGWDGLSEEERSDFLGDMIGTLNYIALNRIESNTAYLETVLRDFGYIIAQLINKQDWTLQDLPKVNDLSRIRNNIEQLQETFFRMSTLLPENLTFLDIETMNAIEKVLLELKEAADLVVQSWKHCGTFHCGEMDLLPQMGRR